MRWYISFRLSYRDLVGIPVGRAAVDGLIIVPRRSLALHTCNGCEFEIARVAGRGPVGARDD